MEDTGIRTKIEPLVKRVLEYHYGPENESVTGHTMKLVEAFVTNPGRKIGDQTDSLVDLSFNILGLSLIPAYGSLLEKTRRMVESAELAGVSFEELKRIDFTTLQKRGIATGSTERCGIDSEVDPLWFVSLVVLALYAYLDVYASAVLNLAINDCEICGIIEKHLISADHQIRDRRGERVSTVKHLRSLGLKGKLNALEQALSIGATLSDVMGELEYNAYKGAFNRYVDIRGKIAHRSPRLAPEEYTYAHFGRDIGEFNSGVIPERIRTTALFRENIEDMSRALFSSFRTSMNIDTIVKMATLYPALLDCSLSVLIKEH